MKWIKFLLSIALVSAMFAFVSCGEGGIGGVTAPRDVVKTYLVNIADGNYDAAVAIFVTKKGKELSEEEQAKMKAFLPKAKEEMDKKGGLKEVVIVEETIAEEGTTATVKYQIVYGNGDKSGSENAKLIKVNNVWRGNTGW